MPYANPKKAKEYHRKYNRKWYQKNKSRYGKVCELCGNEYKTRYVNQKYCSKMCFSNSIKNVQKCVNCGKDFHAPPSKKRRFCGVKCFQESGYVNKDNREWYDRLKQGISNRDNTYLSVFQSSKTKDKNHMWKGDVVGYKGIHMWINNNYRKDGSCKHCGKKGKTEWANINHSYKRDREDWIELCAKCHLAHDREKGMRG